MRKDLVSPNTRDSKDLPNLQNPKLGHAKKRALTKHMGTTQ